MVRYGYKCDVDYNILEICSNLLGVVVIYISLQKFLPKYSFHFRSMFNFYIPLKRQKTKGFLTFSGDTEMEHWDKMGLKFKKNYTYLGTSLSQKWYSPFSVRFKSVIQAISESLKRILLEVFQKTGKYSEITHFTLL